MNWEDILAAFKKPLCGYPVAAARAAAYNPENYERMIVELERLSTQADEMATNMFHLHAMNLLAEAREPRAFASLMRIAALPSEQLEAALGDHLTESFKNCVAATCTDQSEHLIRAFVENREHDEWARYILVESLVLRVIAGDTPAGPLLEWLFSLGEKIRQWLQEQPVTVDTSNEELLMDALAGAISDLGTIEHIPLLQSWSDAGLLDPKIAGIDWYIKELKRPLAERRERFFRYKHPYIVEAINDMKNWHCFSEEFHHPSPRRTRPSLDDIHFSAESPYIREQTKVGRNDPCPCSSGKKYKKCCAG